MVSPISLKKGLVRVRRETPMSGLGLSELADLFLSRSQAVRISAKIRGKSSHLRDRGIGFLDWFGRIYSTQPVGQTPGALFEHVEEDRAEDHQAEHDFLAIT